MTAVCVNRLALVGPSHGGRSRTRAAAAAAAEGGPARPLTPLQRLRRALQQDERALREVAVGRRLGLYTLRGEIGRGSFSCVRLGVHALTADKVAIKVLEKSRLDQHAQRLLSQEIDSMERLHHPNVVRLYEVLETPSRLHLVMEYAPGGELYARITSAGKLPDHEAKIVFAQIVSAVKHMHDIGLVHRDLKAENVFYTQAGTVKVGDFGFSCACGRGQTLSTFCGSAPYAAPELFGERPFAGRPADVWALGVLLFFIATATMPFRADTLSRLKKCILGGAFALPPGVSAPCTRLVRAVLNPLPAQRPTLDQLSGCDWLLLVTFPRPIPRFRLDPSFLAEGAGPGAGPGQGAGPAELDEVEREVRDAMEELGITAEHVRNNRQPAQWSSLTGVYRILLHHAHKRRGLEAPPTIRLPVTDPRGDWARAYKQLCNTSKLCTIT